MNTLKWIVFVLVALAVLGLPIPVFDSIVGFFGHVLAGG